MSSWLQVIFNENNALTKNVMTGFHLIYVHVLYNTKTICLIKENGQSAWFNRRNVASISFRITCTYFCLLGASICLGFSLMGGKNSGTTWLKNLHWSDILFIPVNPGIPTVRFKYFHSGSLYSGQVAQELEGFGDPFLAKLVQ